MKCLPYEKRVFSQHGEDGIIEFIVSCLKNPAKTFLEIGYGSGIQNNSLNLSRNYSWSGVGFDYRTQIVKPPTGVKVITTWLDINSIDLILKEAGKNIDFYSIDIDSIDFWLTVGLMDNGLNPAFVCVEICNPAGPEISIAPPVKNGFKYNKFYVNGASITAWKKFWNIRGYEFLTLDSSGVNAFFYKPTKFFEKIKNYPKLEWIFAKKKLDFEVWKTYFTKQITLEECIITGNEKLF
jgi:hypothetical protein